MTDKYNLIPFSTGEYFTMFSFGTVKIYFKVERDKGEESICLLPRCMTEIGEWIEASDDYIVVTFNKSN